MPRLGRRLYLEDHKVALGKQGLEMRMSVQLYAASVIAEQEWIDIRWNSPLLVKDDGDFLLLRIKGVKSLEDWNVHSRIALGRM